MEDDRARRYHTRRLRMSLLALAMTAGYLATEEALRYSHPCIGQRIDRATARLRHPG